MVDAGAAFLLDKSRHERGYDPASFRLIVSNFTLNGGPKELLEISTPDVVEIFHHHAIIPCPPEPQALVPSGERG